MLQKLVAVTKPAFKRQGGNQDGWVWQPRLNEKWLLTGYAGKGRNLGGFDQKLFDHQAFYVGYNVINVFYRAIKSAKGVRGLAPRKNFHNYIPYNAGECPFANNNRNLQSIVFGIGHTVIRYQIIKIESYGRTRSLNWRALPPCHPLA